MEICSETDSTNECSDFKSELDEDEVDCTGAQQQQQQQQQQPRKSSGVKKNSRVVFVWSTLNKQIAQKNSSAVLQDRPFGNQEHKC